MHKVAGCGIDIEELVRFEKILQKSDSGLINDVFTSKEITGNFNDNSVLKFTLGFSCKEAVFKALGTGWAQSGISWQDVELLFGDSLDEYKVNLNGFASDIFDQKRYNKIIPSFYYNEIYVVFRIILLK